MVHDKIIAVKEASGDMSFTAQISRLINDDFNIVSGNDDIIVPIMSMGGSGVISVLANACPKETHEIVTAYLEGDVRSEELARYAFVWLVMLAASLGARRGRHMCIDFIVDKLPIPLKTFITFGTRLLALFFFIILGWKGAELLSFTMNQNSTGLNLCPPSGR